MHETGIITQRDFKNAGLSDEQAIGHLMTNNMLKLNKEDIAAIFKLNSINKGEIFKKLVLAKEISKQQDGKKVCIAAMPKSGSSLVKTIFVESGYKFTNVTSIHNNPTLAGQNNRADEIEELSLIKNWFTAKNSISQLHAIGSSYTYNLLNMYNYKIIVTWRNIFDCIVSLDDMIMETRTHGFPAIISDNFFTFSKAERLDFLCWQCAPWYLNFFASWRQLQKLGANILFMNYDYYLSRTTGNRTKLKNILNEVFGIEDEIIELVCDSKNTDLRKAVRLNKGISGRGTSISHNTRNAVIKNAERLMNDLTEQERHLLLA